MDNIARIVEIFTHMTPEQAKEFLYKFSAEYPGTFVEYWDEFQNKRLINMENSNSQ